jgi:hypothetical protein
MSNKRNRTLLHIVSTGKLWPKRRKTQACHELGEAQPPQLWQTLLGLFPACGSRPLCAFLAACGKEDVDIKKAVGALHAKYNGKSTAFRAVMNGLYNLSPSAYMDVVVRNFDKVPVLRLGIYTHAGAGRSREGDVLKQLGERGFRLDSSDRIEYITPLLKVSLEAEMDRVLLGQQALLWPLLSDKSGPHRVLLSRVKKMLALAPPSGPEREYQRKEREHKALRGKALMAHLNSDSCPLRARLARVIQRDLPPTLAPGIKAIIASYIAPSPRHRFTKKDAERCAALKNDLRLGRQAEMERRVEDAHQDIIRHFNVRRLRNGLPPFPADALRPLPF